MNRLNAKRIIPIVTVEKVSDAEHLGHALIAANLDIVEVTLRTPAALDVVRELVRLFPDMLVGAGTILRPEQVDEVVAAGAKFGVSPGIQASVVNRAAQLKLPFVPGVLTPSEIEMAMSLNCKLLKFFPAEPAGGVSMLKAMSAPYLHTGIKFIPLGGVTEKNVAEYLKLPSVAAIGGSWIADSKLIVAGDWKSITARATAALDIARRCSAA